MINFALGSQKKSRFQRAKEEQDKVKLDHNDIITNRSDVFVDSFPHTNTNDTRDHHQYVNTNETGRKKVSELDRMLEEIKEKERMKKEIPEANTACDDDNSSMSNIFVNNLPPKMTEETLYKLFCKYGRIQSMKVMWPRTEEERARNHNNGFISFVRHIDALEALRCVSGTYVDGCKLTIMWGKNRQDAFKDINHGAALSNSDTTTDTRDSINAGDDVIQVIAPKEPYMQHVIDHLAKFVATDGEYIEQVSKQ